MTRVELLISDCRGDDASLATIFEARPTCSTTTLETVARLQRAARPSAGYARSLAVLARAKSAGLVTKSGLILGMGETVDEVRAALTDLRSVGVDNRHDRPVPAPDRAPPAGREVVVARGVRRAARGSGRGSGLRTWSRARSCGPRTTPARASTRRRARPLGRVNDRSSGGPGLRQWRMGSALRRHLAGSRDVDRRAADVLRGDGPERRWPRQPLAEGPRTRCACSARDASRTST